MAAWISRCIGAGYGAFGIGGRLIVQQRGRWTCPSSACGRHSDGLLRRAASECGCCRWIPRCCWPRGNADLQITDILDAMGSKTNSVRVARSAGNLRKSPDTDSVNEYNRQCPAEDGPYLGWTSRNSLRHSARSRGSDRVRRRCAAFPAEDKAVDMGDVQLERAGAREPEAGRPGARGTLRPVPVSRRYPGFGLPRWRVR